jgi:hypothetical protein
MSPNHFSEAARISRPSDAAGVYAAEGARLAVGAGSQAIVLTDQEGAVLELSGKQVYVETKVARLSG